MSEIDQQFIEYVVKSLVGKPEAVKVERRIDEKGVLLELTVDPDDLGRVIGKRGATAQSLRTLLRALGTKNDARYNLKIIDNGTGTSADEVAASDEVIDAKADRVHESSAPAPAKPVATAKAVEPADKAASDSGDETSERLRRAREELADLDDLDV